jgi:outer membrane lipoprotein-sorting protein
MTMHHKNVRYRVVLVLLLAVFTIIGLIAADQEPTGASIMQKVTNTQTGTSSAIDIRMLLIDSKGEEKERRIQTLSLTDNELTKTITVFLTPASVRNTRFLTIEKASGGDDQWIYLPALGKVKRIAATETGGSFMGSDFTYADMASTSYEAAEATHTIVRQETYATRPSHVVESIPLKSSDYGKTITWVDSERYVALRVEFYGSDASTLLKILTSESVENMEGRWLARKMTMQTLSTGHRTAIEILQAKFNMPLNPSYFTVSFLETGRL